MNEALVLTLLSTTPYTLVVEVDSPDDVNTVNEALGRLADNYAPYLGGIYAGFHYSTFDDMLAGLRKVPASDSGPRDVIISDARVQFALPPAGHDHQSEQRAAQKVTYQNSLRSSLPAPFLVSAKLPWQGYDAIEVTGRDPFVVIGEVAIFTFDDYAEAVAACTRLAVADGTYDDELQNSEIN